MTGNLTRYEKMKIAERTIVLERAFGLAMGDPMTIEQADQQNANPNFQPEKIKNPQYDI